MAFSWIRVLALAAAIVAADSATALAARAPGGSYRDSCSRAYASHGTLFARCERGRHRVRAKLEHYASCIGDIGNHEGRLICLRRRDLPDGDWKESCIRERLAAPGVFAAICKSLRGGWIASEIALDKCPHGLTNAKGHLGCMKDAAEAKETTPAPSAAAPPAAAPAPSAVTAPEAPDEEAAPPPPDTPPQALPAGSYQSACRKLDYDGRYLSGECRDKRGKWQETSLDTKGCARDQEIGARDGVLICTRSSDGRQPPVGAYQKTCRKLSFDGRFVRGECQENKGRYMSAVLDTRTCKEGDDIVNDDGEIVCRRTQASLPPAPPTPPAPAVPPAPTPAPTSASGAPPAVTPAPPAPTATPPVTTTPPAAPTAAAAPPAAGSTPPPTPPTTGAPPATNAGPGSTPAPPAASAGPGSPAPTPAASAGPAPTPPPPAPANEGNVAPGAPGSAGAPPTAPARLAITLYEKENFSGASRTFTGDAPDLAPLGWSDLAASVQVRGIWQVCEEPNYGGLCANVKDDEADLTELRLMKQISSFRHVTP